MKKKVILAWFRNDLRFHDNEVLSEAAKDSIVIPVYCFDERYYSKNSYNNKNTGILRANFIREGVIEFKERLQAVSSDLLVFKGLPEEIIPRLAAKYEVDEVFHHREVASRETNISERVETALWSQKINLKHFIGHTLFHKEDLPFPIRDIPEAFTAFKKQIERESSVREVWETPLTILSPAHLENTTVPTLEELGFAPEEVEILHSQSELMIGGEQEALRLLECFLTLPFWKNNDYTKISPYVANGLLSPIYLYHRLQSSELTKNKKVFERVRNALLWRDYFRFMLKKHPNIFFRDPEVQETMYAKEDLQRLENWKQGNTGITIIDNALKKLKNTGVLPYYLRKIVGVHFIQEYKQNWLVGAAHFEEQLIDYEPATTYGYWAHLAGIGTSKKESKQPKWKNLILKIDPKALESSAALDLNRPA